jgi:hypothetical protein
MQRGWLRDVENGIPPSKRNDYAAAALLKTVRLTHAVMTNDVDAVPLHEREHLAGVIVGLHWAHAFRTELRNPLPTAPSSSEASGERDVLVDAAYAWPHRGKKGLKAGVARSATTVPVRFCSPDEAPSSTGFARATPRERTVRFL